MKLLNLQTVTVQCASGDTTDEADGQPGTVTYQSVTLQVKSVLEQMMQTGVAYASVNDCLLQNGVTTTQVLIVTELIIYFL